MKLLVDADACPVTGIAVEAARRHGFGAVLLCDTNHVLSSDYASVITVGAGRDAVDFELLKLCCRGDIVVTQDYGLAALVLARGAYCLHQSGMRYTDDNIDALLLERHLNKKARRSSSRNHGKGPSARTGEDDRRFAAALEELLNSIT